MPEYVRSRHKISIKEILNSLDPDSELEFEDLESEFKNLTSVQQKRFIEFLISKTNYEKD